MSKPLIIQQWKVLKIAFGYPSPFVLVPPSANLSSVRSVPFGVGPQSPPSLWPKLAASARQLRSLG
jgi:hypothetical protein